MPTPKIVERHVEHTWLTRLEPHQRKSAHEKCAEKMGLKQTFQQNKGLTDHGTNPVILTVTKSDFGIA